MTQAMRRGRFISFEGVDGAGKSTQHQWLAELLRGRGFEVVATREPGGTPLGEKLRSVLLSEPMDLKTEALLMFASRREHVVSVIEPALARGAWVLCDRFTDASMAYQGGGRGLSQPQLQGLADWVLEGFAPDLTLLFDAPVDITMARLRAGTANPDRFEQEQEEFFNRVRGVYLELARSQPERIRIIDASRTPSEINSLVEKSIARLC